MPDTKTTIVIKKKVAGHGGHHGGAWKVAYADFVTAMMSLFIVLWLMNSSASVKQAVAGYFQDPAGVGNLTGTNKEGKGQAGKVVVVTKDDMPKLMEQIERALQSLPDFKKLKNQISMTITSEGLRIELLETEKGMFFESGSAVPTPVCVELLRALAVQLGEMPNHVLIEGHTDARPFVGRRNYSNWELSTDRANQARALMESSGLRPAQVAQVRGFADQSLRDPAHPNDAANRRISVVVPYQDMPTAGEAPAAEGAEAKEPEGKEAETKEKAK
jgi:chemotaxis protein MotB